MAFGNKLKSFFASIFRKKNTEPDVVDTMARFLEKTKYFVKDEVEVVPYDPRWPEMYEEEKALLRDFLPSDVIGRIEHYGSTAMPGMASKPIIDMLVEVTSIEDAKRRLLPIFDKKGYDVFWKPISTILEPPYYPMVIKRNAHGHRTHHIHLVEEEYEHWEKLIFRDYMNDFPEKALEYQQLKEDLARKYPDNRRAYANGKTAWIDMMILEALKYYKRPSKLHIAKDLQYDSD